MATHITDDSFEREVLIGQSLPVLVDFWAEWCGPCRSLAPILDRLAETYKDNVKIVKIDTDANPLSAQTYQITGIPCCILFKDGKEVTRFVGFQPEAQYSANLKQALGL